MFRQIKSDDITNIILDGGGTLVVSVISAASSLLTSVLLTRVLGANSFGLYAWVVSCVAILSFASMAGVNVLLAREVSAFKEKNQSNMLWSVVTWGMATVLVVGTIVTAITVLVSVIADTGKIGVSRNIAYAGAVLITPFALLKASQGSVRGLGHATLSRVPRGIVFPAIFIVSCWIYIIFYTPTPLGILWLRLGAIMCALVCSIYLMYGLGNLSVSFEYSKPTQRRWVQSGLWFLAAGVGNIVNERVTEIIIGVTISTEATGYFNIARKGSMLIALILASVNMPLAPKISQLYRDQNVEKLNKIIKQSTLLIAVLSLIASIVVIYYRDLLLSIFGKSFQAAGTTLSILVIGQLTNSVIGPVGYLLKMTQNEKHAVAGSLVGVMTNIALSFMLIPWLGIEGGAIAMASSVVAWNIYMWKMAKSTIGINTLNTYVSWYHRFL